MEIELRSEKTITAAVVADTHIPDRVKRLHPALMPLLRDSAVDLVLHAGDISQHGVLKQLREIAPVYAVRGNRDLLFIRSLPASRRLIINGNSVLLTHGHLDLYHYWRDKIENVLSGYRFERYHRRLLAAAGDAKVIIYGHSHHAENRCFNQRLFFNPGSCSVAEKPDCRLSFGIIQFTPLGEVKAEIISLES